MAQINKQSVMQKLIDELQLFPAQDVIPTQLAEKIVPTFQVNTEEITVSPIPAQVVRSNQVSGLANATIYAVPATGKFYLTNIWLNVSVDDNAAEHVAEGYIEITIDGTTIKILHAKAHADIGQENNSNLMLNLQNPILLDQSTNIQVYQSANNCSTRGGAIGYYQAP